MATEEDKVNTGALATLVAVLTFAVLGIALAVTALTRDQMSEEFALKDRALDHEYRRLHAQQDEKLAAGLPIEQAMQQVVAEIRRDPSTATPPSSASAVVASAGAPGAGGAGAGGAAATAQGAAVAGGASGGTPSGIATGAERSKAQGADRLPKDATRPSPGAKAGMPGVTDGNAETAVPPNGQ